MALEIKFPSKPHQLLFPQDRRHVYVFPASGKIANEAYVDSSVKIRGQFTANLGSKAAYSGTFDVSGVTGALDTFRNYPVIIQQAAEAYTGKGTLRDEIEMDMINISGYVYTDETLRCYWNSPSPVMGNYKFNYII